MVHLSIGAVLTHLYDDGTERPIAYVSRTLNSAEKNYSQLEKEGLAVIFGVRKFDKYCYGRRFIIYTDHKPLTRLFDPSLATSSTVAARIQRWSLFLGNYSYDIVYKPGNANLNADCLSRLPLPQTADLDADVMQVHDEVINAVSIDANKIATETRRHPVLSSVLQYLNNDFRTLGEECNICK